MNVELLVRMYDVEENLLKVEKSDYVSKFESGKIHKRS